jgi:hypothetical protein
MSRPLPAPWSTRAAISAQSEGDSPQSAEPAVKMKSAPTKARFAPKRSPSQALSGMQTATLSR